ncbi:MAG: AAA family ATPase [Gemmatimonadaceae bacterium]
MTATSAAPAATRPSTPWTAAWHLRAEVQRIIEALGATLATQRTRGRSAADDAVRGLVIQDGETEGLLADLAANWRAGSAPRAATPTPTPLRAEIAERARLGAASGAALPLLHAAHAFELRAREYDALVLALAVELDARLGRVVAYLNDHVGRPRPTVGLAFSLGDAELPAEPLAALELSGRPAVRDGLLVLDDDGPAPTRAVRIAPEMLARLASAATPMPEPEGIAVHPPAPGRLAALVLDDDVRERVAQWGAAARRRAPGLPALIIAGASGSGRRALAHAAVSETARALVSADLRAPEEIAEVARAARREARWHDAAIALHVRLPADTPVDWRAIWRELEGSARPLVVTVPAAVADAAAASLREEPIVVRLAPAEREARARLWRALLPPGSAPDVEALAPLASRFRFSPGRVAQVVRRAAAAAHDRPAEEHALRVSDLERAAREIGAAEMGTLAQRVPLPFTRADLVVPESVAAELDLAVAWVHHRHTVLDRWGFGQRIALGRGMAALFAGRPGTGKTMAAQVLACELGCELFRVDLSRVMSKYIGETEKQLARLFDEAEAGGVMLFFDEADAIFGKRTEVKDAHDRYANVEIGYLLQRIEEYEGVTVLATNRMRDLDEAFVRRFHVIVHFPMPGPAERLAIWRGMLPETLAREPALDVALAPLVTEIEVSGGEIRNAALAAAYLAAGESAPVGARHIKRALRRELAKNGRIPSRHEAELLEG